LVANRPHQSILALAGMLTCIMLVYIRRDCKELS
jgi:hypothetical protein